MAKFAPVAPIQVLEGLWQHSPETFGDYHLLLAHHTVEYYKRFEELFHTISDTGRKITVIMDNSIVELGSAVNTDMIADAVSAISFPGITIYPVLPDVMGNGSETRAAVATAYEDWIDLMPGNGFMAVCQGETYSEYLISLHDLGNKKTYPHIEVLGIPRIITKNIGTRIRAVISAKDYEVTHQIHLLGFSDNITDDIDSAKIIYNCGIDSAVPLRVREIFTEFLDAGPRAVDWFDTAKADTRMIKNLQIARQMFA